MRGLYFTQEGDGKITYGIWIENFDVDRDGLSILAHELHHIIEKQSKEKGFDCMETKAYLMEYYLNEVLKKYNFN